MTRIIIRRLANLAKPLWVASLIVIAVPHVSCAQGTLLKPLTPPTAALSETSSPSHVHKKKRKARATIPNFEQNTPNMPSKPVAAGVNATSPSAEYPLPPDDQINVYGPLQGVIDGATIVVKNYTIRLSEITAIPREGFAKRMATYVSQQGAPISCTRLNVDFDPARNFNCNVNGHDLALVSALNGGADTASTSNYAIYAKIGKDREHFIENNGSDPVVAAFLAGTFTTSCAKGGCGDAFLSGQYADDIELYQKQQWEPLVRNLLRYSAKLDLYYYLLGSVSDSVGSYRAAQRYLAEAQRLLDSGSTTERCQFAIPKNCDGADIAFMISAEKHKADEYAATEF